MEQSHKFNLNLEPHNQPSSTISSSDSDVAIINTLINDRSIADGKDIRLCTNYPIYNFVSYKGLSSSHYAFINNLDEIRVPSFI